MHMTKFDLLEVSSTGMQQKGKVWKDLIRNKLKR